jgi:ATP-dependent Clp protease protease subunit
MNYGKEFQKFAMSEKNISSLDLFSAGKTISNSMTPYILEERELRATQMDIFSRLMIDRIIWVSSDVNSKMASIIQAQLMFLSTTDSSDINLYLDTPGGSVLSGLGIRDTMNYVKPDVSTINVGMCASMGSILLSSGAKGKRNSLIFSKVMTHMVSHGTQGNIQDTRINQLEAEKYNYMLFKILAENTGKTFDEVYELSRNDKWFNSDEALEFGLIDNIIGLDRSPSISEMMEGFEDYYSKEIMGKK